MTTTPTLPSRLAKSNKLLFLNLFGTIVLPNQETDSFPGGIMPDTGMRVRDGVSEALVRAESANWIPIAFHNSAGVMSKNPETRQPYLSFSQNLTILYRALWLIPSVRCVYFCCDWGGKWGYRAIRLGRPTSDPDRRNAGTYSIEPTLNNGGYRLPDDELLKCAIARYGLIKNRQIIYVGSNSADYEVVSLSKLATFRYLDIKQWIELGEETVPGSINQKTYPEIDEDAQTG